MIELVRYARVKPQGLASSRVLEDGTVCVEFKRFDVENGKEVEPERSILTFLEIETRLAEIIAERAVVEELLALKPASNA